MGQLFSGLIAYVNSWRGPFAVVALLCAVAMWMKGHHFFAVMEILGAIAVVFTVQQFAAQMGWGG